ncbi:MAG: hypothetical protein GXP36_15470 [Actinobacteria bacterium]|nr:hypothetical protein [Actinomycetota bacterium]
MTDVSSDVKRRVEAGLRAVIPDSVDLALRAGRDSPAGAFEASIRGRVLNVEWVGHAWLSVIEKLLARSARPDIIVGYRVSPASRQALTEAGIGWVETTGAAEIETDFLVVSRTGETRLVKKTLNSWTRAVLGVAEAILTGVEPTVSATHEATGLSVGACIKALRALTDMQLLEADAARGPRSGRRITDRDALLDAYVAAAHDLEPSVSLPVGVTWRDPVEGLIELGDRWDRAGVAWVATGLVAAAVVAPLVTSVGTANVYVVASTVAELDLAASAAGLRPIEGGRLVLAPLPTRTTLELATAVDGMRVVPWPRLVADLRRSGVRGEEAAEHVREVLGGR